MAISLMPNEILDKEKWMIPYPLDKSRDNKIFPIMYLTYMDKKRAVRPNFLLYKYKDGYKYHPSYICIAFFGKSLVQIVVPLKSPKKKVFIQQLPYWKILGIRGKYDIKKIELNADFK